MKTLGTFALILTVAGALTACSAGMAEEVGAHKITYRVSGTKKASINYTDGGTKTSQDTGARIPWTKTVESRGDAIVYQVNAPNSANRSKRVGCTITMDGKVVDRNVARGQFAIADCQYAP